MKSIVISMAIVGLLTCAAQAEETSGPTYSGSATRIVNVANQITDRGIVTHQHQVKDQPKADEYGFFKAYVGASQNLVQLTKSVSLNGEVKYIPEQAGDKSNLFAGLVITNAKPLVNLAK